MATAAEIRGQIYAANTKADEAFSSIQMAMNSIDEAIQLHVATDSTQLASSISTLMNAKQRLEEALTMLPIAKDSASAYALKV